MLKIRNHFSRRQSKSYSGGTSRFKIVMKNWTEASCSQVRYSLTLRILHFIILWPRPPWTLNCLTRLNMFQLRKRSLPSTYKKKLMYESTCRNARDRVLPIMNSRRLPCPSSSTCNLPRLLSHPKTYWWRSVRVKTVRNCTKKRSGGFQSAWLKWKKWTMVKSKTQLNKVFMIRKGPFLWNIKSKSWLSSSSMQRKRSRPRKSTC